MLKPRAKAACGYFGPYDSPVPLTTTFHLRVVATILPEEEENYGESSYRQACKNYGIRFQPDFTPANLPITKKSLGVKNPTFLVSNRRKDYG